jgi:hypothetical protein
MNPYVNLISVLFEISGKKKVFVEIQLGKLQQTKSSNGNFKSSYLTQNIRFHFIEIFQKTNIKYT